jgi:hypothetical protein
MRDDVITYALVHGPSGEILERNMTNYREAFNRIDDYNSSSGIFVVRVRGIRIIGPIDHSGQIRKTHHEVPKTVWEHKNNRMYRK